jgi:uracil-DNA glycosylase family 4
MTFSENCRECPRLAGFLDTVRAAHPDYYAKPVAPFGAANPALLIVGLAPGMHGANRSGRPFTGDFAGILLYQTLYKFGFSSAPVSTDQSDGLTLKKCRITNAVKCLPPQNKPSNDEVKQCNHYLTDEIAKLAAGTAILALGTVAHQAVLMATNSKRTVYPFSHGARHQLATGMTLFDSYHCSRYNTQTRRLTEPMFEQVFAGISEYLAAKRSA